MPEPTCPNCGRGLVADSPIVEVGKRQTTVPILTEFLKPGKYKLVPVDKADAPTWRCPQCGVTMCEGKKPVIEGYAVDDIKQGDAVEHVGPPSLNLYAGIMPFFNWRRGPWWRRLWWRVRNWWGEVWRCFPWV